jgi:tRNA A37 threonylcarbamoyladenosine dehydratase
MDIQAPFDFNRRFGGIGRLYGTEVLKDFRQRHIAVVGVGGVGSWAVEALARSGIGQITLIDFDQIAESNTNRQLPAIDPFYGEAKVSVLAERILQINPSCQVHVIEAFVDEENLAQLITKNLDGVIDAIDQVKIKTLMAVHCLKLNIPLVVSGSAGGKCDPTQLTQADLSAVTHDPLLSNMRYDLRRRHGLPREGKKMRIACIYSTEPIIKPIKPTQDAGQSAPQGLSCSGYGASMMVTASFGLAATAYLLNRLSLSKPATS